MGGDSVLTDTHAHVQMPQFARDREDVIAAAFADGIARIVVPGIDLETSRAAVALATAYPARLFAGVGTHPHDAATLTDEALAGQRALARTRGRSRDRRDRPGLTTATSPRVRRSARRWWRSSRWRASSTCR